MSKPQKAFLYKGDYTFVVRGRKLTEKQQEMLLNRISEALERVYENSYTIEAEYDTATLSPGWPITKG